MVTHRCCIFAHYDRDDLVDPYVYEYVSSLKPFVSSIVFVSTSRLSKDDTNRLEKLCSVVVSRKNYGYDFYSWKIAMELINLDSFDEILQVNDSCYAPIFPFKRVFDEMDQRKCDFWGLTKCYRFSRHLQSYFVCYRKTVIQSAAFQGFWGNLRPIDKKSDIVRHQEVGISRALLKEGFTMESYFDLSVKTYLCRLPGNISRKMTTNRNLNPYKYVRNLLISNPTAWYYNEMLEKQVPTIKVSLINGNPRLYKPRNLYRTKRVSKEVIDLIRNHQLRLGNKTAADSWVPQPNPE